LINETQTGNYFRYAQYQGCTSLQTPAVEVLPNSVTTIGDYFRYQQYYGCSSLLIPADEVLPNSVTTIGDYFRGHQYSGTSLTTANLITPASINSIGANFRGSQFSDCTKLTTVTIDHQSEQVTGSFFYGTGWSSYSINDSGTFTGAGNSANKMTISILHPTKNVLIPSANSMGLNVDNVAQIKVPPSFLSAYRASVNWSNVASKFVAIS